VLSKLNPEGCAAAERSGIANFYAIRYNER
jgi:hypothetical protein